MQLLVFNKWKRRFQQQVSNRQKFVETVSNINMSSRVIPNKIRRFKNMSFDKKLSVGHEKVDNPTGSTDVNKDYDRVSIQYPILSEKAENNGREKVIFPDYPLTPSRKRLFEYKSNEININYLLSKGLTFSQYSMSKPVVKRQSDTIINEHGHLDQAMNSHDEAIESHHIKRLKEVNKDIDDSSYQFDEMIKSRIRENARASQINTKKSYKMDYNDSFIDNYTSEDIGNSDLSDTPVYSIDRLLDEFLELHEVIQREREEEAKLFSNIKISASSATLQLGRQLANTSFDRFDRRDDHLDDYCFEKSNHLDFSSDNLDIHEDHNSIEYLLKVVNESKLDRFRSDMWLRSAI